MIATILPQIIFFGLIPGVFIGLLIGGICNAASKADERMEARIRDEWQ